MTVDESGQERKLSIALPIQSLDRAGLGFAMDWAGWDKEISAEKGSGGARKIAIVLIIHSVDPLLQTGHRDFYQDFLSHSELCRARISIAFPIQSLDLFSRLIAPSIRWWAGELYCGHYPCPLRDFTIAQDLLSPSLITQMSSSILGSETVELKSISVNVTQSPSNH